MLFSKIYYFMPDFVYTRWCLIGPFVCIYLQYVFHPWRADRVTFNNDRCWLSNKSLSRCHDGSRATPQSAPTAPSQRNVTYITYTVMHARSVCVCIHIHIVVSTYVPTTYSYMHTHVLLTLNNGHAGTSWKGYHCT